MHDGILIIEMEAGGETWHCGVWLSTYGLPEPEVEAVREQLDARLTAILGPAVQAEAIANDGRAGEADVA